MDKYTGPKLKLTELRSLIDEVVMNSYHTIVEIKYEVGGPSNRHPNNKTSVSLFKKNIPRKMNLNVVYDFGDTSMDPYDQNYQFVCSYHDDKGWHFLWVYLNREIFFNLINKHNFKLI